MQLKLYLVCSQDMPTDSYLKVLAQSKEKVEINAKLDTRGLFYRIAYT